MKHMIVDIDGDKLNPFRDEVLDLINKYELSVVDVFIFSMFYSVEAADQLTADKEEFLLNASNMWDLQSKYSNKYQGNGTQ